MTAFINNDFSDIVLNRKSIRRYDDKVKISREEMLKMLDEANRAPSSVNLQPWRYVVVDTKEGKEKLKPFIHFNQLQNDTSAAMILIFGDRRNYEYGEEIYGEALNAGLMPKDVHDRQLATIIPYYQNLSLQEMDTIIVRDASLAAMQFMLVARAHGYDTNAIGGFEAVNLATTFDLDEKRYLPVLILSVGKAAESGYQSVRLSASKLTTFK
ncbi:nitroreductase [Enterococcus saigonensis]|uniref:Nitroreductase n=1 Tax=Enterococcus saigonensis TaxID=1805431 RepID=A0A679ISK4_9ENTE|nr:nitroreductase family protein [Enterococcus saigonensis]BCA86467.1 nitroreductase [Enterococcus saigonensis]